MLLRAWAGWRIQLCMLVTFQDAEMMNGFYLAYHTSKCSTRISVVCDKLDLAELFRQLHLAIENEK
jgi:hypothetical protein